MKRILYITLLFITLFSSYCKQKSSTVNLDYMDLSVLDSVSIIEDSLIIDEGGIYSIDAVNDSIFIVDIDGKSVYLLNIKKGIFTKRLTIPKIEGSDFLKNTNWNAINPNYKLISIKKGKYDWVEKAFYNRFENCFYLYYCPIFNLFDIKKKQTKSLMQTILLKYNVFGIYETYYFLPDNINNCDSCFPGVNYDNIFGQNNFTTLNINLNKNTKNNINKPLLLHYSPVKNYLKIDSLSSIFRYDKNTDNELIYQFSIYQDINKNKRYFSDGLNIFNLEDSKSIFTIDTAIFKQSYIEKFTFYNDSLIIALHNVNIEEPQFNCIIFNTKSKKVIKVKHYSSPIYFINNKLVYIGKNRTDENYKIYSCMF